MNDIVCFEEKSYFKNDKTFQHSTFIFYLLANCWHWTLVSWLLTDSFCVVTSTCIFVVDFIRLVKLGIHIRSLTVIRIHTLKSLFQQSAKSINEENSHSTESKNKNTSIGALIMNNSTLTILIPSVSVLAFLKRKLNVSDVIRNV